MDWLDLARYADTYGYQADVERDMSPYRDWVIRAFNDNLPYDQFLTWQLAGDLLPNATREQRIATAFNRLHRQTNEGGSIEEEFRTEYVVDRVNTFGTAMLGLTIECARCHDHKFDADHAARLLFAVRLLQQHRRVRPLLALHERHAVPVAAALAAGEGEAARSVEGANRRRRSQARGRLALRTTGVPRLARDGDVFAGSQGSMQSAASPPGTSAGPADRPPRVRRRAPARRRPTASRSRPAQLQDGPVLVHEGPTAALRFSGDNRSSIPACARSPARTRSP